jgi:hypothetical protein
MKGEGLLRTCLLKIGGKKERERKEKKEIEREINRRTERMGR